MGIPTPLIADSNRQSILSPQFPDDDGYASTAQDAEYAESASPARLGWTQDDEGETQLGCSAAIRALQTARCPRRASWPCLDRLEHPRA